VTTQPSLHIPFTFVLYIRISNLLHDNRRVQDSCVFKIQTVTDVVTVLLADGDTRQVASTCTFDRTY